MRLLSLLSVLFLAASTAHAAERTIRISGRTDVVVTTADIRLGDLAEISSSRIEDDEAVIGLKKIWIEASPSPGEDAATLSASQILERISGQGVDLHAVEYVLPRVVSVKRAGRLLDESEVRAAVESHFASREGEVKVHAISLPKKHGVPPGQSELRVETDVPAGAGRRNLRIAALVDGQPAGSFETLATIEEFRDMPVARRSVAKGQMITDGDIYMARFNTAQLPQDAVEDSVGVVGMEATSDIFAGEVFRTLKISPPQLIEPGAKVVMQFKSDFFEATASGVALEGGALGQEIRVRNDTSKKIVSGEVIEQGIVRVK